MNSKRYIIENNIETIKEWEKQNIPLAQVARYLDVKYDTLVKHLKALGVHYRPNPHRKGIPHLEARASLYKILEGNSSNSAKRKKLIEAGIKEAKCECCGLSVWMGKPIPLELHHKDFNHRNNDLNNLQILCSNCHMQAHNYNNTKSKIYGSKNDSTREKMES